MSAERILETIAAEMGWSEDVQIAHLLGYIENQASDAAFEDYLRQVAEEERCDPAEVDGPAEAGGPAELGGFGR